MDDLAERALPPLFDAPRRQRIVRRLTAWFAEHARDLPWRRTPDLYAIWVSEIMLQQTQVATVIAYHQRFLKAFPDVRSLAAAREEQVLRLWEGLGYYRRARQLHAAAQAIVAQHDGTFPTTFEAVRALPGIGRYTAGAILSIGLDQRLPILEANTIRVLSRLTAFRGDPASSAGQRHLWSAAEQILPRRGSGTVNQALMELGSEICTPREPACDRCPIARLCPTRDLGLQAIIPAPKPKTRYEAITEAALVIDRGGRVLVRQCGPGERWAGLWDFPRFPIDAAACRQPGEQLRSKLATLTGLSIGPLVPLTTIKHGVTRFRITLHCFTAASTMPHQSPRSPSFGSPSPHGPAPHGPAPHGPAPHQWLAPSDLATLPLSTTGRKIARLLLK